MNYLLFFIWCVICGALGALAFHTLRYGLREAWADLRWCIEYDVIDIPWRIWAWFKHFKRRKS